MPLIGTDLSVPPSVDNYVHQPYWYVVLRWANLFTLKYHSKEMLNLLKAMFKAEIREKIIIIIKICRPTKGKTLEKLFILIKASSTCFE